MKRLCIIKAGARLLIYYDFRNDVLIRRRFLFESITIRANLIKFILTTLLMI